jgi:hypothetical protein
VQSKGAELEGALGTVVGIAKPVVTGTVGTLNSVVEGTVGTPPAILLDVGDTVVVAIVGVVVVVVVDAANVVVGAVELDVTITGGPQTGATPAAANSITVIEYGARVSDALLVVSG